MSVTLKELASRIEAQLDGDGEVQISGVAGVRDADQGEIAYVALSQYIADAEVTKASALIVAKDWTTKLHVPLLRVENPEAAYAKVAQLFAAPTPPRYAGIHPTAVVSKEAVIGADPSIGPHAVIEAGAKLGDRCTLHAGVYIGQGVSMGDDCIFYPNVSIREYCRLGNRVILHNGTVIGCDGFGYSVDKQGIRTKLPHVGIVIVGDDVEMGANVTVDRARFGRTKIGKGVKIDNLVQIGHNVVVGDYAVLVAQVGIAGSCIIGRKAILAGQVGVAGHLVIGDGAVISAQSGVTKSVPPGSLMMGFPAVPQKEAALNYANISRLPELKKRVRELEQRLKKLEAKA